MGIRVGAGLGPLSVSAGLPKLGVGRGVGALMALFFAVAIWTFKIITLATWWTCKLAWLACVWMVVTIVAFAQSRRTATIQPPSI